MKRLSLISMLVLVTIAAGAAELTLNDLPTILKSLRGCVELKGAFSTTTTCRIDSKDLWVSVDSAGALTLFRSRSYGDTTYARGSTVTELLSDFARKTNYDSAANKAILEALTPFLPTQ